MDRWGTIVAINNTSSIVVNFDNITEHITVVPHDFTYDVSRHVTVLMKIVPLVTAWAISVHKSQSLSLSSAVVDTNCFVVGQMYTAFSRLRSIQGLHVIGDRQSLVTAVQANKFAIAFERGHFNGLDTYRFQIL